MSRWVASQGTQGKLEFLGTAALPWGKLAEWGLTGRTTQVSLAEAMATLKRLEATDSLRLMRGEFLEQVFGKGVVGYN